MLILSTILLNNPASKLPVSAAQPADSDRDGLSDEQEQSLLERFRPVFMISKADCAVRPARFAPDLSDPKALAEDGTIYGQVFPLPGNRIEIHYYTLWDKDCGRMKHPLDAEHVSVLVSLDSQAGPREIYWYAGAHENTACDISSAARFEEHTPAANHPVVWSSSGKHALFLRKEMCGHGCGADSCLDETELSRNGPVINIGELDHPMNNAVWVKSASWPLSNKMRTDFSSDVLTRLESSPADTVSTVRGNRTLRGTIDGADAAVAGGAIGAQHTQAALNNANGHTSKSLSTAAKATGRALHRAWQSVFARK